MVINPTIVMMERASWPRWPSFMPNAMSMRENSLIWATVNPAKKLFFFVYPSLPMRNITMTGFPTSMMSEKTMMGRICWWTWRTTSSEPNAMKNKTMKKSLKTFILELISKW